MIWARDADLDLIITGCVQPTVKHKRILTPVLSVWGDQVSVNIKKIVTPWVSFNMNPPPPSLFPLLNW